MFLILHINPIFSVMSNYLDISGDSLISCHDFLGQIKLPSAVLLPKIKLTRLRHLPSTRLDWQYLHYWTSLTLSQCHLSCMSAKFKSSLVSHYTHKCVKFSGKRPLFLFTFPDLPGPLHSQNTHLYHFWNFTGVGEGIVTHWYKYNRLYASTSRMILLPLLNYLWKPLKYDCKMEQKLQPFLGNFITLCQIDDKMANNASVKFRWKYF